MTIKKKRSLLTSALALLLCVAMLLGTTYAWFSDFISSGSNIIISGNLDIGMYWSKDNENWTWVKTFDYTDYSDMLGYDDFSHTGHVQYNGTIGRYYKAYVCIWAGKNGAGDTRYFFLHGLESSPKSSLQTSQEA